MAIPELPTQEEIIRRARDTILTRNARLQARREAEQAQREAAHALRQRRERMADLFPELVQACQAAIHLIADNNEDGTGKQLRAVLAKAKEVRKEGGNANKGTVRTQASTSSW